MADSLSTVSTLNNLLKHFFVPEALMTLYNETPLYEFAVKAPQPKGSGNITYWNQWTRLAHASSTLAEGGNNSTTALSSRRVSATVGQYGRGIKLTDLAEYMTILDSVSGAQKLLRESAKETLERVLQRGIYKSTYATQRNWSTSALLSILISSVASGYSAVTGTLPGQQFQFPAVLALTGTIARLSQISGSAPSLSAQLSLFSIRKTLVNLRKALAKPFADGKYVGYANAESLHSLMKDPTWVNWNAYTNSKETMYKGEVGETFGVRWIRSQLVPRYAVAARSVNCVFVFGQEAFGITEVDGGLKMFMTDPETVDTNNPYGTFAYLTYKLTCAAVALNPSAGRILVVHEKI